MRSARKISSALLLTISVITTATVPAFAGSIHPVCTVKHHDCGEAASIRPCCCGDQDGSSDQSGPVESKAQVTAPATSVLADLTLVTQPDVLAPFFRLYSGTTRAAPPDLLTLFATLLL
jgi:hypothetical protein